MTREALRATWRARVAAFKASPQSMKDWCAAEGIRVAQLEYWMRHFAPKSPEEEVVRAQSWQLMTVQEAVVEPWNGLRLLVGPICVEVLPGFDRALLLEVVRTLETRC